MLTEERHAFILEQVKRSGSVTMTELCEQLGASESTVRRDLTQLDEKGLLKKVHGGAIAADDRSFSMVENDVESKSKLFTEEKTAIARYAASLIDDGDLVFIDAGTTTEKMIDFLPDKSVDSGFVNVRTLTVEFGLLGRFYFHIDSRISVFKANEIRIDTHFGKSFFYCFAREACREAECL